MSGTRSVLLRAAAPVQAALLLLAQLADGSGIHRCPAHDAVVPVVAETHGHAAGHHHQAAPAEGEHHGSCSCLGSCCGSVPVFDVPLTARAPVSVPQVLLPRPAGSRTVVSRPPHLLPFSLAPPLSA